MRPGPRRSPGAAATPAPPRRAPFAARRSSGSAPFSRSRPTSAAATARARAVRHWVYRYAAGAEAFRILRIDYRAPDGAQAKSYRPCHQAATANGCCRVRRAPAALQPARHPRRPAGGDHRRARRREMRRHRRLPGPALRHHQCPRGEGAAAHRLVAAGRPLRRHHPRCGRGRCRVRRQGRRLAGRPRSARRVHIVALPGLADGEDIEQFIEARRCSAAATPTSLPSCTP